MPAVYSISGAPLRPRYLTSTMPWLWSDTTSIHVRYFIIQRLRSDNRPWHMYDAT